MARDLEDENYYSSQGGMIPVKWTAPEVRNIIDLVLITSMHANHFDDSL